MEYQELVEVEVTGVPATLATDLQVLVVPEQEDQPGVPLQQHSLVGF